MTSRLTEFTLIVFKANPYIRSESLKIIAPDFSFFTTYQAILVKT